MQTFSQEWRFYRYSDFSEISKHGHFVSAYGVYVKHYHIVDVLNLKSSDYN